MAGFGNCFGRPRPRPLLRPRARPLLCFPTAFGTGGSFGIGEVIPWGALRASFALVRYACLILRIWSEKTSAKKSYLKFNICLSNIYQHVEIHMGRNILVLERVTCNVKSQNRTNRKVVVQTYPRRSRGIFSHSIRDGAKRSGRTPSQTN